MSPMSEFAQSFHQLTSSVITPLVQFLQLKYRINDQAQTTFTAHPTTMLVALSSFLVYYLLHIVLLRSRRPGRFAAVLERFVVWSGYTAVAGLAAAVFPDGASPFLYAIFGFLSAGTGPTLERVDDGEIGRDVQQVTQCTEDGDLDHEIEEALQRARNEATNADLDCNDDDPGLDHDVGMDRDETTVVGRARKSLRDKRPPAWQ